ncbi:transcriptional regulator, GntR family [Antarctobacter heliothermus]|uniref:Transcriptional regulator, GntR family n=1 Tax=Antarctobacter heliothermus TaxID=74033 RepID=A0A239KDI5_9RHOB|nr:transcriptional regulator, GntR family [Antarctobacter heliothermus]
MHRVSKSELANNLSAEDLVRDITQKLEEDIVFGHLHPRERLVEEEIAERFGVKRYIARQAILQLERLGLVERIRNRGAVVRLYSPKEVNDINMVREQLESQAAQLIPLPLDEDALKRLEDIQIRHSRGIDEENKREIFQANIAFHKELFGHCGNDALVEAINIFAQKSHSYRSIFTTEKEALRWAADAHSAMIKACRDGDREKLVQTCREHLAPAKNRYIEMWKSRFS